MFDVTIVGASPAGLVAARECAKNGAKVMVLDERNSFENTRLPDTSFYGFFDFLDLETSDRYIKHKIDGMKIISPFNNEIKLNKKGFSLDREKFSNYYLNKAKSEGANIRFNSKVTDVNGKKLTVNEEKELKSKIIIFACGSRSKLLSDLNIKTMKYPNDVARAIQADMKNVDAEEKYFHYYLGSKVAPGWKVSINPKGNNLFSVGAFVRGESPERYFEKFLEREMFDDASIIKKGRGEDQIITIPHKLVHNNYLFVGGAAGQAGIPFSMKAGELCGKTVKKALEKEDFEEKDLREYQRKWRKRYNRYYKIARFSLKKIEKMSDKDLDKAIKSLDGDEICDVLDKHSNFLVVGLILSTKMFKKDPRVIKLLKYFFK